MYEIVKADMNMLGDITDIENEAFTCPWSEKSFADAIASESISVNVIESEGKLCGFYCLLVIGVESELLNIAVSSEFRQKGLGSALMEHLIDAAKAFGAEIIFLEVRESNAPARRLYKKYGFTEIGVRKNYYNFPRENAVVMEKNLK